MGHLTENQAKLLRKIFCPNHYLQFGTLDLALGPSALSVSKKISDILFFIWLLCFVEQSCTADKNRVNKISSLIWGVPNSANRGQPKGGCPLWAAPYGRFPMGAAYGLPLMAGPLWAASYRLPPMGVSLWAAPYGQSPMVSPLWVVPYGRSSMGCPQWDFCYSWPRHLLFGINIQNLKS